MGGNYPGWSSPDYDRLIDTYNTTLDQGLRYGALAQAAKIMTEDVSCIPTVYNPRVIAFRSNVIGPVAPNNAYNIHEWVMK